MANPNINRFEWLKALMQSKDLTAAAKNVANALAVQFCSDETHQINPKAKTLAEYLKVSLPTIKRAIRDLTNAGWLNRTTAESRKRHFVEHDLAGLLRGDQKARFEAYRIGREWGWLSPNEIRRLENMSEIEDGDEYLSPLNMTSLGARVNDPGGDDG